jgi:hypothetical protein
MVEPHFQQVYPLMVQNLQGNSTEKVPLELLTAKGPELNEVRRLNVCVVYTIERRSVNS